MPLYRYQARDKNGKSQSASLEAPSRREALRLLAARGLTLASLHEESDPKDGAPTAKPGNAGPKITRGRTRNVPKGPESQAQRGAAKARRKERLPFLEALYDLTSSGLSAGEAVRLLSVRLKEPALRSLCQGLWDQISEGAPLSRALANYAEVFDAETVNLIAAGETTGSLNETLQRLIAHLTEQRELRRQLLSEMAYPAFMFFVAGGVILFFLFFLLPRMQVLLTSLGGKLPASTQLLIGLSHFALHYGLFLVAGAVFGALSFWRWRTTEPGRRASDAWLLKVPFLGSFLTSQTVLAISQTLSVLLENGITTAEALKMTERQIPNRVHREAFAAATARVLEGEALSVALGRTRCFPDLVIDRLSIGENTGNLVPGLKEVAKSYRLRLSRQLSGMTRVLSSGVMTTVFLFVGFIAYAIVSAVFSLSASFNRLG